MEITTTFWRCLVTTCLVVLAGLHSGLGERRLLRPLFAAEAYRGHPLGRRFAERTQRFAWHLTSLAWLGLGVVAHAGPGPLLVAGVVLALSGGVTLFASRGQHLAWPVFLLGAFAAAVAAWPPGPWAHGVVGFGLGLVLWAIGLLHVYWALGGRRGLAAAIPEVDGRPRFRPGPLLTLLVAAGLFGGGVLALLLGPFGAELPAEVGPWASGLSAVAGLVFLLRTAGDLRDVGVLKRRRGTTFARLDDGLYSPLSFSLGLGFLLLGVT